jgi:hypothetical protein
MLSVIPTPKERSAYEWFKYKDHIDMKPGYQRRGGLWSKDKQSLLINSMINGIDIPKIYFADFSFGQMPFENNFKLYAVIDGKQRLEAIFKFFSDELVLHQHEIFTDVIDGPIDISGLKYSEIKEKFPKIASQIEGYKLTIMSVFSDDLKYIREMFIRLNQSVSISGPEKRNAMHGVIPEAVRDLAVHDFFIYYMKMPTYRGQDLNLTAKMLLLELSFKYNTLGSGTLDNFFVSNAEIGSDRLLKASESVAEKLTKMQDIFQRPDSLLTSQNMILIYYMFSQVSDFQKEIRSFLKTFEDYRKKISSGVRANTIDLDSLDDITYNYVRFNLAYRSPDNRTSIDNMIGILQALYLKWRINKRGIIPKAFNNSIESIPISRN